MVRRVANKLYCVSPVGVLVGKLAKTGQIAGGSIVSASPITGRLSAALIPLYALISRVRTTQARESVR